MDLYDIPLMDVEPNQPIPRREYGYMMREFNLGVYVTDTGKVILHRNNHLINIGIRTQDEGDYVKLRDAPPTRKALQYGNRLFILTVSGRIIIYDALHPEGNTLELPPVLDIVSAQIALDDQHQLIPIVNYNPNAPALLDGVKKVYVNRYIDIYYDLFPVTIDRELVPTTNMQLLNVELDVDKIPLEHNVVTAQRNILVLDNGDIYIMDDERVFSMEPLDRLGYRVKDALISHNHLLVIDQRGTLRSHRLRNVQDQMQYEGLYTRFITDSPRFCVEDHNGRLHAIRGTPYYPRLIELNFPYRLISDEIRENIIYPHTMMKSARTRI